MMTRARALVLLAAAACVSAQDECPANAATCVGQTCTDPDTTTPNNWYCSCNLPAKGYPKTGAVATCVTPVGECLAGQAGATACPAGQVCVDPNAAVAGDWQCQCLAPATGAAGMQAPAAACTVNECTIPPACAGAGTAQQCTDPSQVMAGDWQCACVAPQVGYPKLAARAGCFTTATGECAAGQAGITGCAATALQVCVDPNAANANDWTCNCKPPATGTMGNQAAATCTLNECEILANAAICPSAANQACEDLTTGVLDDWKCKCTAPWTGASVTKGVATCTLDECTVAVNAAVCTAAAQTCNDPNTAVAQDWTCTCPAPATGTPVVKAAATCVLDECLTAANAQVCTAAGQTCVDPTKTITNKEDWTCTCRAPATGAPVVKAVATCTTVVDECVANGATCPAGTQTCNDPNQSVTGDWLCKCNAPNIGQMKAAAATCVAGTDECANNANKVKCTGATPAQVCEDPNFGALNDWRCACTGGVVGRPVVGGPATCVVGTDECVTAANKAVCTGASPAQECVDTNYQSLNNWECRCTGLQYGPSKLVAVATCATGVDECAVAANAAICPAGQTCSDPNFATTNDWTCRCNAPAVGVPLVKKAAVCFVAKTVAQTSGQSMAFRAKVVMASLTRNMFTLPLREIIPAQAAQIVLMYVCPVSIVGTTYPTKKEDKARCTMARDIRASSRAADTLQGTKEDVWVEFDVDAVNTASLDDARNAAYNAVAQELQKVSPNAGRLAPVEATSPLELRPSERGLTDPYAPVAGGPVVTTSEDDGVSKVWMWLFIVAAVALCLCLVALLALLLMSKKKKGGNGADADTEAAQQRQKQYEMQQQQQQPQQPQQQQQRGPGESWDHPQAPVPGRMGGASPSPAGQQPQQPPTQQKDVYEAAEAPQQTQYSSPGDDFAPQWQNGDKVDAKYGDDWFPAQVVEKENGGTYTINWDDGTHSKSIPPESLRRQY